MNKPPKGATHTDLLGGYYHEREDGQFLSWLDNDGWHPSPAANRDEIDLRPLSKDAEVRPNDLPVTPEEDELWEEGERRMRNIASNGPSGIHYDTPLLPDEECDALKTNVSDGSTASYYELPEGAKELQDLISYRDLNAQDGEIFRAIYRKGRASHSDELRDAKKVLFYAKAEVARLEALI